MLSHPSSKEERLVRREAGVRLLAANRDAHDLFGRRDAVAQSAQGVVPQLPFSPNAAVLISVLGVRERIMRWILSSIGSSS